MTLLTLWLTRPRRRMSRAEWASLAHQLGAPQTGGVDRTHRDGLRALRRAWLKDEAK